MSSIIRIDPFSEQSLDDAIQALNAYKERLALKEKELLKALAEHGVMVAQVKFTGAKYDGVNDVTVRFENDGNKATIFAEGKSVVFIEFGSGYKYGYGHPLGENLGFVPGSWSDGEYGMGYWDNPDGWYYGGKKTYGNPPAMAMYQAITKMAENIGDIATEVFKK